MAPRKFFVGGNWKCVGDNKSVDVLTSGLLAGKLPDPSIVDIVVTPPFLYLHRVQQSLSNSPFLVGAQNCWSEPKGAFTGEISAPMLKDNNIQWVILGHSERRHIIGESNDLIGKKTASALSSGLSVILCIGEQLDERESNQTEKIITSQLEACVPYIQNWANIVIAYEPVWAIGTGKVANPEQAQEAHQMIRQWLQHHISASVSQQTRIIYGGSVKPDNCIQLSKLPDVDGFLVGGASLLAEQFLPIIDSVQSS